MPPDLLKSMLDGLPLPAFVISEDARVLALNPRAAEMFGALVPGRNFMAAVRHPALVDCIEEALARRSTRRTRFLNSEFGRDATYEVSASPIDGTQARGLLITFLDVTEREQVSQIRRDFVANVSHELKTPLTALMGFIETLKGPAREDAAARARFLDIMEREAARMNRLVHDLLSLSRVEAEERMRPDARVNIVALVNSAVVMLRPIAEEKQVRIEIAGHVQPLEVQGDPDQLMQVFTNLIENAIKYGGSESCVTVQITPLPRVAAFRGPGLQVEVCDEGDGIAPHHLPRLTERFYRVDTHRSREMGGTGLGLAIVKHIVNRHRGRFRIDSTPGVGSRFAVILPVQS